MKLVLYVAKFNEQCDMAINYIESSEVFNKLNVEITQEIPEDLNLTLLPSLVLYDSEGNILNIISGFNPDMYAVIVDKYIRYKQNISTLVSKHLDKNTVLNWLVKQNKDVLSELYMYINSLLYEHEFKTKKQLLEDLYKDKNISYYEDVENGIVHIYDNDINEIITFYDGFMAEVFLEFARENNIERREKI